MDKGVLMNWKGRDEEEEVERNLQVLGVRRWRESVIGKTGEVLVFIKTNRCTFYLQ
jgi:hypothetical protein